MAIYLFAAVLFSDLIYVPARQCSNKFFSRTLAALGNAQINLAVRSFAQSLALLSPFRKNSTSYSLSLMSSRWSVRGK